MQAENSAVVVGGLEALQLHKNGRRAEACGAGGQSDNGPQSITTTESFSPKSAIAGLRRRESGIPKRKKKDALPIP